MASHKRKQSASLKRAELAEGSPELERAFEQIARAELKPIELSEPDTMTTNDGTMVDLRAPWFIATQRKDSK
jgi:hypothetical protein